MEQLLLKDYVICENKLRFEHNFGTDLIKHIKTIVEPRSYSLMFNYALLYDKQGIWYEQFIEEIEKMITLCLKGVSVYPVDYSDSGVDYDEEYNNLNDKTDYNDVFMFNCIFYYTNDSTASTLLLTAIQNLSNANNKPENYYFHYAINQLMYNKNPHEIFNL